MTDFDTLRTRRARTLRAARAATLSASIVGLGACGGGTDSPDAFVAIAPDAFVSASDDAFVVSGEDAPSSIDAFAAGDAPVAADDAPSASDDAPVSVSDDAFTSVADGGCGPDFPPTNQPCCELAGGFWDAKSSFCAVAVPGPFVPPSMVG